MVQTRSAAKRQQAEEAQRLPKVLKRLVREPTVVEITPSETGLGAHIRWLRPPQHPNEMPEILSPDLTEDPRFVTPAPENPALLRTPPKLSRQRRIGNPGIFNTGTTVRFNLFRHEVETIVESARIHDRDLLTEFERYSEEEGIDTFENVLQYNTLALGSPFPGTHMEGSTTQMPGQHGTHDLPLNDFDPTSHQGSDTGYSALRLGPHGTHLDISQDDSDSSWGQTSLGLTQPVLPTGRGLGPCDTVLLGPDGRAIVPGIRPGYCSIATRLIFSISNDIVMQDNCLIYFTGTEDCMAV